MVDNQKISNYKLFNITHIIIYKNSASYIAFHIAKHITDRTLRSTNKLNLKIYDYSKTTFLLTAPPYGIFYHQNCN